METAPHRVWDDFLTVDDKANLLAEWQSRKRVPGTSPALLLVDLYRWVFGDEPAPIADAIATWEATCGLAGWSALPSIATLLHEARKAGIPIVHAVDMDGVADWGVLSRPREVDDPARRDRIARRYDIMPEVQPRDGELVLRKAAPSAFWGTPLLGHLNGLGIDTLIVAGESTSGCVRATVVDGRSCRYTMVVVEQCVFDRTMASHAMSLFDMHQKYAAVLDLQDVMAYLRHLNSPRQP